MIRKLIEKKLKIMSKLILRRHKPDVIAITGSIGKTSTKVACFHVLNKKYRVRKSERSYNTEISVPLTIIGVDTPKRSIIKWRYTFLKAVFLPNQNNNN